MARIRARASTKKVDDQGNPLVRYHAEVRVHGLDSRRRTFSTREAAEAWAEQTERDLQAIRNSPRDRERFVEEQARGAFTVTKAIERYNRHVTPTLLDGNKRRQQLAWLADHIGHQALDAVDARQLSALRDKLAEGEVIRDGRSRGQRSPASVNRYLAAWAAMFTACVKKWHLLEHNPMRNVERLTEGRGRVRWLKDDERDRLLEACKEASNEFLYPAVLLALSTGARRSEVMRLQWSDIDVEAGAAYLENTKNGERRMLHIRGTALDQLTALSERRRKDSDLVFPRADGKEPVDLTRAWRTALATAEIENFRWHDLRHCAASYMAMSGASLNEIAEVLGHKTLAMARRYSHLSTTHTASVVERMVKKVDL